MNRTPLGLDHPVWVDDEKIDLDYHIRHAALPKPGGMAELRALVAQLHAVPLDRARPLWEYTFIEGLEGGGFAVYVKVHHSAMDGIAGMATLGVIYDFEPDAPRERLPARAVPQDREPEDSIELASTAIGDFVRQGWRAVKSLPSVARTLTKAAPNLARDAKFLYGYVKDMPRTPFNVAISGHRIYATASLPLHEVKALARAHAVTVNDVVLALTAGAVRRYLSERGALPEKPLTAGVPASLRPIGDAQLNNQVVFTVSRLPTDVAEPLPRLMAAKAAGREAKNLFTDTRELVTTNVSILGAPVVTMGIARLWAGAQGRQLHPAVRQPRRVQRAGSAGALLLRRREGDALFPGVHPLSRQRPQRDGAELSRHARLRADRLQRDGARRAGDRRFHGRGFRRAEGRRRGRVEVGRGRADRRRARRGVRRGQADRGEGRGASARAPAPIRRGAEEVGARPRDRRARRGDGGHAAALRARGGRETGEAGAETRRVRKPQGLAAGGAR